MTDTEDDETDEFEGLDDEEMREALLRRLQTKDALKAIRTSVAVCDDKKAPAAARVQAASNILRAGGFFSRRGPDEGRNKEPGEMNGEELRKFSAQAQRELPALLAKLEKKKGVFD